MIRCSISEEKIGIARRKLFKHLRTAIAEGKPFDMKAYMENQYNDIYAKVNDPAAKHATALDYARLVPHFVQQAMGFIPDAFLGLQNIGFDFNNLATLYRDTMDEATGLDAVERYLELTKDVVQELVEDNVDVTPPIEPEIPPVTEEERVAPTPAIRKDYNFVGQTLSAMNAIPYMQGGQPGSAEDIRLGATPLYDVLSEDRNNPNNFFYKVKRKLIGQLPSANFDSSNIKLGEFNSPVYLTAMSVNRIKESDLGTDVDLSKDPNRNGVLLVLTDSAGDPFRFDEDGNPNLVDGRIAYYKMRSVPEGEIQLNSADYKRIDNLAKAAFNNNKTVAKAEYIKQLELIRDIREHVTADKERNQVQSIINGGTVGFAIKDQKADVLIKDLDFEGQAFAPQFARLDEPGLGKYKGRTYFYTDGFYGQPIEIERPTVDAVTLSDGTLFKDKLISLLVDPIQDKNGEVLLPKRRRDLIEFFIKTGGDTVRIYPNKNGTHTLKLKDKPIDISTPTARVAAKKILNDYFSTYGPIRQVDGPATMQPKASYTAEDRNKVIKVTEDGVTAYFVIEKPKLHIRGGETGVNYLQGKINDVNLSTDENGNVIMEDNTYDYKDFIKNNYTVRYMLHQKKIRKFDAYFTFQPTEDALNKLYGTPTIDKIEKTVEENPATALPDTELPGPLDVGSVTDLLKNVNKDNELNKLSTQKNIDVKASADQIAAAKTWYENSPLSKHIPLDTMFTMVNTKNPEAIATWAVSGITLYKGADYSDVYHEAWHGFTQSFLTKADKQSLYNETRKKTGGFTDYRGNRTSFKTATDLQLEEYLAEDFRKFMLNGGKAASNAPKRNSIFRRILAALKALFTNSTVQEVVENERADATIGELYEKLRVGNLAEYTFNQENVQFGELNKGVGALTKDAEVQALSYENSRILVDTIDSLFSEWADLKNSGLTAEEMQHVAELEEMLADPNRGQSEKKAIADQIETYKAKQGYRFSTEVFNDPSQFALPAYKYAKLRLGQMYNAKFAEVQATSNPVTKARLTKDASLLYWAWQNFGDTENLANNPFRDVENIKGLMAYHMAKSEKYMEQDILEKFDIEEMSEEDQQAKGRRFEVSGNELSMKELASKEIIYLIRGLHKTDSNGNKIKNKLGANELVEFQEVWNRLARTLQNTLDIETMEAKLLAEANDYPVFKQLLQKLGPVSAGTQAEVNLWSNFWQAFNKTRIPLIQMTLEKQKDQVDGRDVYQSNIGEAFNNDIKVGRRWEAEFRTKPDLRYVKRDDQSYYLDLPTILDNFQTKANAPAGKQLAGREREFLHAIGWKIADNPEILKGLAKQNDVSWIHSQIKYLAARGVQVRKFEDITTAYEAGDGFQARPSINGRFKRVQRYHARYADETSNFMVTNAEGNTQFEHSLNNSLTVMVNSINDAPTYDALIAMPHMAHLDITKNPFAAGSNWLNSIFDMEDIAGGRPKRKISDQAGAEDNKIYFTNLSGILLTEEEGDESIGIASAKADEVTKLILDFHLSTQLGQPELMRHADKSTSYSAYLRHIYNKNRQGISSKYINNTQFLFEAPVYNKDAYALLVPQINAEYKRIGIMRNLKDPSDIDFKYWQAGQNFVAFDDVLKQATKQKILAQLESVPDLEAYLATDEGASLKADIMTDMSDYFATQVDKVAAKFNKNEFIANNVFSTIRKEAKSAGINQVTTAAAKDALIKSFVYNTWINNLETINLFYGDLALYNHKKEEFHKRNAGMGSTGTIYRTDQAMQDFINNGLKREYSELNGNGYGAFNGTMETAVIKDNEIKSAYFDNYLDAYTKFFMTQDKLSEKEAKIVAKKTLKAYDEGQMNEGDAQGWIGFDSYRILKITEGSWSPAQEKLYQDIVNNKPISARTVTTFFPTIKAQYFGVLQNSVNGLPVTAMHKFSLFPLIPSVIKATNLETLHNKMMTEGIDYSLFESGSKVGTITKAGTPDEFYKDGRKEISSTPFTKNTIFLNYLKNQLEIAPKFKKNVIFSTQLRKLIEDGLMENGVPTDFEPGKSANARMKAWDAIDTEEAKRKKSKRYDLLKQYENNIQLLTDIKKKQLLDELKWTSKMVKGKEVVSGKLEDLITFVKRELNRQDLADHEIDFLAVKNGEIKHDLSLSLSTDKIEKLLNALVVKRLVKQKVKGEGLIQISGALFESFGSTDRDYKNPTAEDLQKYGTNDLPTYHIKANGATAAMKVKVALQGDFEYLLEATDKTGERIGTLEKLNELIKDEEWLNMGRNREMITMVGVRIPVQGLNSMEFMEVYEFLPKEAGNIIVPPAEIVAKSGSDFDIDKLSVMMPNLKRGNFNEPTRLYNYTTAEAKDLYKKYVEAKKSKLLSVKGSKIDRTTGEPQQEDLYAYNRLLSSIFGMDLNEMDDDLESILLDEGELKTEEQFIHDLIGAKSVENDLISNIRSILALPENFISLTRPNSTDIVKGIADELAADVMDYDPTDVINGDKRMDGDKAIISPTRALEIEYNIYKHATNNIGKQTLGLGAVDNTYNTIFNRIGFYLNPTTGTTTAEYERILAKKPGTRTREENKAIKKYHRQKLFLPHNTIDVAGEKAISLAHDKDADNKYRIADVINQLLNGWVDIAKDTWIFNIQGNKEVTPVLMFLLQSGVPVKTAIYFASMPLVRQYVREQRLAKSTFAGPLNKAPENPNFFRSKAREEIFTNPDYGFNFKSSEVGGALLSTINKKAIDTINDSVLNDKGFFDEKQMRTGIADYGKAMRKGDTYAYNDLDRAAFLHFIEAENMAMPVRDIKLKMNFDTTKSGTLFEAQNRILMKESLKYDARIPVEMVEKILTDSPIGSFYVQPFQLKVWKNLFQLRNHPTLNRFILNKFQEGNGNDVKRTFGDTEKFANEFRNDLVSFIFQNSVRSFGIENGTYRGYEVNRTAYELAAKLDKVKSNQERLRIEKQLAAQFGIPVSEVTVLKQGISRAIEKLDNGAYALGDVLYVDKNQLKRDYQNKLYTTADYTKRGLAKVNSQAFETADEYYNFVYEREILRKTSPMSKVSDTISYLEKRNTVGTEYKQYENESADTYKARLDKLAYEEYLRDTALTNTFNHWALFKSDNSYAEQFNLIRTAYPELAEDYSLVDQLSIGTSGAFTNLKLNDNLLDSDMLNILHENLLQLMDPNVQKVPNEQDNAMISEYFKKFPIVAFLQSGMNTKSAFSLTRLVPQDVYLRMLERPVKEYVKHFDKANEAKQTPPILDRFYDMFVTANSFQNRRGKIRGKKLNADYKLSQSIKDLGKKKTEIVEERMTTVPDPLVAAGTTGLLAYSGSAVNINTAKTLSQNNPNTVFIYNYATDKQFNATVGDHAFYQESIPNAIGLPTRLTFGAEGMEMTDVDGTISEKNRIAIEDAITAMKQAQADGKTLAFNRNGYGQYMIGEHKNKIDIARETFLYLSKRLFDEFNFINPGYLGTDQGLTQVQATQPITDDLIKQAAENLREEEDTDKENNTDCIF